MINKNKKKIVNLKNKNIFINECIKLLPIIKNIKIKNIKKNLLNETVIIEFRCLNHLEFIIRNMIIKLPNWSHTVICGNINYEFIKKMNIHNNLNIIKLNINNCSVEEYNNLLLTEYFWNLLNGEKVLIYQEDSFIFHNKINNFLKYDYIGAPWGKNFDGNKNNVGNGGFSLRTKSKMIDCIKKIKPNQLKLNNKTIKRMKICNLHVPPEDIYFSKTLIDFNLGLVAPWNIAREFSEESVKSNNSLGGHQFWIKNPNRIYSIKNFLI